MSWIDLDYVSHTHELLCIYSHVIRLCVIPMHRYSSSLRLVARRQVVLHVATPNKDQSLQLQEALFCELMLDWYPSTIPSASYKTKGKVWPIVGILR